MGFSRPQKPGSGVSTRWVSFFCIASFFLGVLVVNRFWAISVPVKMDGEASSVQKHQRKEVHPIANCDKASLEYKVVISYIACRESR
ncbi:hypothetical protein DITRI_Ditri07aG0111400 [Diplodiscus trichospermus]